MEHARTSARVIPAALHAPALVALLGLAGCDASVSEPATPVPPPPVTGPYAWTAAFDLAADLADGICLGTGRLATRGFECQRLAGGTLQGARRYVGPSWIEVAEPSINWWAHGTGGWHLFDNNTAPALVTGNTLALGNLASDALTTTAMVERVGVAGRDMRQVLADFGVTADYDLSTVINPSDVPMPAGARFPAGSFAYRLLRHDEPAGVPLPVINGMSAAVTAAGGMPADVDALPVAFADGNAAGDWLGYDTIYTAIGGPGFGVVPWGEYEVQFRADGTAAARLRWLDSQPVEALPDLAWSRQSVAGLDLLRLDIAVSTERDSMHWLRGVDAPWHSQSPGAKYWVERGGQVYPAIVSPPRADRTLYAFNRTAAGALMHYLNWP